MLNSRSFGVWLLFLIIVLAQPGAAWSKAQRTPDEFPKDRFYAALKQSYSTKSLESRYLREARRYRAEGRYELARQSYVQALSLCSSEKNIMIIRQELNGIELLLRTMR